MIDDIYVKDAHGSEVLNSLNNVHQFNHWTAAFLGRDIGSRVLELGAGIGNLTLRFLPRRRYVASDINQHALAFLRNMSLGKPYLEVRRLDATDPESFRRLAGQFDTVLCLNLLEHVLDPQAVLENLRPALEPGGKVIVLVPQGQWLYSSLDLAVGHTRRFGRAEVVELLRAAGFRVAALRDFNRLAVAGWLVNGRLLRRERLSLLQLKVFNTLCPYLNRVDDKLPWPGLSLVAIGENPGA